MTILRNFPILINLCSTAVDVIRKIKALISHQLISGLITHNSCIICGWVWSPFRFYCSLSFQCCGNTIWVLKTQKITQDHLRLKKIITEKFFDVFSKGEKNLSFYFSSLENLTRVGKRWTRYKRKNEQVSFNLKGFPLFASGQMKEPVCLVISI